MDADASRSHLPSQVAALVVVMVGYLSSRLKRKCSEEEPIVYGPRVVADEHRQKNLQLIYISINAECIAILRMSRAPFFLCVICLGRGGLW